MSLLDVFPALALGGERIPGIMQKPPRDAQEPILTGKHWALIFGYGVLIALPVLAALWIALLWLKMPQGQAVTISFLTLGFSRLGHTFNMRNNDTGIFRNEITRNPFVWGGAGTMFSLVADHHPRAGISTDTPGRGTGPARLVVDFRDESCTPGLRAGL